MKNGIAQYTKEPFWKQLTQQACYDLTKQYVIVIIFMF
jgi:hypothetical protein